MSGQRYSTGYLLGQSEAEARRLHDLARRTEDETRAVLARLGLRKGAECLDVGYGAGDVMRLMAEYASADGAVTGLSQRRTREQSAGKAEWDRAEQFCFHSRRRAYDRQGAGQRI
jgi:cyclopropane fatty-acyl-phospholipid synthase-like methyltransferase